MASTILTLIEARKGSKRLPSKVLLDLEGRTVLEHVIRRIQKCSMTGECVVATTISREDLAIVKLCAEMNVRVYCGSEEDPLERYFRAASLFDGDPVIRIKADCPLIDSEIVDAAVRLHLESGADYTSNTLHRTYPVGQDVEILALPALERVWRMADLHSEREHITLFIPKHAGLFRICHLENREDLSAKRWTLDYPEDYVLLRAIFHSLYPLDPCFGMGAVLDFLSRNPELEKLNAHIPADAGVRISLQHDRSGERPH